MNVKKERPKEKVMAPKLSMQAAAIFSISALLLTSPWHSTAVPPLEVISFTGRGAATYVALDVANELGITVTIAPGAAETTDAEHAIFSDHHLGCKTVLIPVFFDRFLAQFIGEREGPRINQMIGCNRPGHTGKHAA